MQSYFEDFAYERMSHWVRSSYSSSSFVFTFFHHESHSKFWPNARERGAFAFVSQILTLGEDGKMNYGLREIDLSVNQIGFYGVFAIEKALKKRSEIIEKKWMQGDKDVMKDLERQVIEVDLEGNMVFQEVRLLHCGFLCIHIDNVMLSFC